MTGVVTRFAPSPTGFLHIGGARTALFNWLYAKHTGGQFLLRIEDTDRARSTEPAVAALIDGLKWLGLDWDGEAVFQFARASRHAEVANEMVARGKAFRCYVTPEELSARRDGGEAALRALAEARTQLVATKNDLAKTEKKLVSINETGDPAGENAVLLLKTLRERELEIERFTKEIEKLKHIADEKTAVFRSPYRNAGSEPKDTHASFVVRLRAPDSGETVIEDQVQGRVNFPNKDLDDMVLLRSDGTPTYMLAVVVDDHDMGITHVIRGDDHLTNAARQTQIYEAMGWDVPSFAHIPLIHGQDGAKLSKRHGALGVEAYRAMGYLPDALRNYLARLGWAHGDDEIFSTAQAIEWFGLDAIGRSPSRFDFVKLKNLNAHYIRQTADAELVRQIRAILPELESAKDFAGRINDEGWAKLEMAMPGLKERAQTLDDLLQSARYLFAMRPLHVEEKALKVLDTAARSHLAALHGRLASSEWTAPALEHATRAYADEVGAKLGAVAQPLRVALTGSTVSPPVFDVASVLGRDETLARIADQMAA